ncbi:hypothetical protein ES708_02440 [subsurface metagenome]
MAVGGWINSGEDLTATFNSWYIGGADNYGLRLYQVTQKTDHGIATFDSKETVTPAQKPYFIVTYTKPGGFFLFMCEAYRKGEKYFKKKGLYLPDNRLFKPEILIPEGI